MYKRQGLIVTGVELINWNQPGNVKLTHWYPRSEPYELKVNETAAPLKINGDLRQWPVKSILVDVPDSAQPVSRILSVEMERRHFDVGGAMRARIQAVDARRTGDAASIDIAKAAVIARVQGYGAPLWTDLPAKVGASGEVDIAIPEIADGIYKLLLGVKPAENEKPLAVERWISIARPNPAGIGLFTKRGRVAYQRGEDFWLGLAISGMKEPLAAGTSIEVDLVDGAGVRLPVLRQKSAAAIKGGDTFIVRLEGEQSLALAAGKYAAEARCGDLKSRSLPLEIVEGEQATHFTNLITGKYNPQGEAYSDVLKTGEGADALARSITEMGHNSFKGMSYDLNRVVRGGLDIEQVARERHELGPWESYYQPSSRDRFLDAAVRHNLRFYENMMTYNDTMLPRDPKMLEAITRYTSLETASLRHSPAFKGVCIYDEVYSVADTGTPMSAQFLTAEELTYRAKHPGMTSADSLRALLARASGESWKRVSVRLSSMITGQRRMRV